MLLPERKRGLYRERCFPRLWKSYYALRKTLLMTYPMSFSSSSILNEPILNRGEMCLAKISNFPASLATNNGHLIQVWMISHCQKSQARAFFFFFFLEEKGVGEKKQSLL